MMFDLEMAVILPESAYVSEKTKNSLQQNAKQGLELSLNSDEYFVSPPQAIRQVESRDSQLVPDVSSEPSNLLDLSPPNMSPTLDTPSIIDSIVDVLPFRFHNGPAPDPVPPPGDILSAAAASAMLGIEDTERFQDITELVNDPPMPMVSQSPAPLLSPTGSIYSDVTVSSPDTLLSAASSSRDSRFFSPDFDMIEAETVKAESSTEVRGSHRKDSRYAEMRRRNNLASRRSRLTRREKERELEQQLKILLEENAVLKTRVRNLENIVEKTKKVIIDEVTKRQ